MLDMHDCAGCRPLCRAVAAYRVRKSSRKKGGSGAVKSTSCLVLLLVTFSLRGTVGLATGG